MEVEVFPGKLSLISLITIESNFVREEGTRLITNQNTALDSWGGREKSKGAKGEVKSPMPGVFVGLKVKVGDETFTADIF